MEKYDVIVLGSGPSGSSVAYACADAGRKVAVIDGLFGGICGLKGCTPKKAMESVTSVFWEAKDLASKGFQSDIDFIDWNSLHSHKSSFTALIPSDTKTGFEAAGISTIVGYATFLNENILEVEGKEYHGDKIIIATGAKPRPLNFYGSEHLLTTDHFFELDNLPKKIVIVGGGYVGFELSHIIAACGSEVTIISDTDSPMQEFDKELVSLLVKSTLHKGIEVKLGFEVTRITKEHDEEVFTVEARRNSETPLEIACDLVIHAAGRVPAADKLMLDHANIETNKDGSIVVNEHLQASNNTHIFAMGDVIGTLPFTEIANYEASVVIHNLLSRKYKSVDYTGVPIVVYTYPKIAVVRKDHTIKEYKNSKFITNEGNLENSFIQKTKANDFAKCKTIVEKSTNKIVEAQMIGYNADEVINMFAAAIKLEIPVEKMKELFLAYPTAVHEIKQVI